MSLCVFCKGSFLIAFCRILCYSIIAVQQQQALCCKMQVVKLPPGVKSGGVQFLSSSGRYECFYINGPKEESIMDVLNTVFSVLNLLATVIIGVIQVTWMISKDVFRDRPRAKHYSCNKKD